jgi:hypothetical protein
MPEEETKRTTLCAWSFHRLAEGPSYLLQAILIFTENVL